MKANDLIKYLYTLVGSKQYSKVHKKIVNEYNTIKPLPRGYRVKYSDQWCATTVSWVLKLYGKGSDVYECSAQKMLDKCKKMKYTLSKKAKIKPMDIVFYDWDKNGVANHVGIVVDINDDMISVFEGNKNRAIGIRKIKTNSEKILAFARVK